MQGQAQFLNLVVYGYLEFVSEKEGEVKIVAGIALQTTCLLILEQSQIVEYSSATHKNCVHLAAVK